MRRLALLFAFGLGSTILGCHHLAGVCDCDWPSYDCPVPHIATPVNVPGPVHPDKAKAADKAPAPAQAR